MNQRQTFGRLGEDFAAKVLASEGYNIIERNYTCRDGEIDIVAEKGDELFFVEVKTRRNNVFGDPCEAVNRKKQMHLRKAASRYLAEKKCNHIYASFQVIEIGVRQITNAF